MAGDALGIDIGTTFTAAALHTAGRTEVMTLGERAPQIPSIVCLRADGQILVGEAAERRSGTEPSRTAREFKRRLGDPVPLLLGGTPYGAETLYAHVLHWVVDRVSAEVGSRPSHITLAHPANYSPYKLDLVREAVRLAEIGNVSLITEPTAAAVWYASRSSVAADEVVAVYDFGGGTFDAAVVHRTADGFELLGQPDGIERLGGIDLDQAVFAHVESALAGALDRADRDDPATRQALSRLREECRGAKEALSSDTDVQIPVMLPGLNTEVRMTRSELEAMIRPRIGETMKALDRAVRSAGIQMSDVGRILLVGGSSRIPMIGQMVQELTGRPIAVDAQPKFAVALGAAAAGAAAAVEVEEGTRSAAVRSPTAPPPELAVAAAPTPSVAPSPVPPPSPAPPPPVAAEPVLPAPEAAGGDTADGERRSRTKLLIGVGALVILVGGVIAFVALSGGGGGTNDANKIIERFETFNNGDGTCTAEFAFNSGWRDTTEVWVLSNGEVIATGTPGASGKILYAENFVVNGLAVSKNGSAVEEASPDPSNC